MKVIKIILLSILGVLLAILLAVGIFAIVNNVRCAKIKETGMPRIDVYTEGEAAIKSKEDYVDCTVSLSGADAEFCFENLEAGIRGRGNTTWKFFPKKPYRIKFDEKTSMFGEKKNKSWVLLAMYNDFSLVKDRLAFGIADALETDAFVPSYNYVDLYINGKYAGIYLLSDQVDENSGRTSVKEDFTAEDTEVPFLVELDEYAYKEGDEDVAWFKVNGYPYTVKYPEADERYTEEQFRYIKDYIATVDALVRKGGVTMAELSEYLDMESFIDFYIVQELMGQIELNWKSVYMSKAVGEPLKMGPVWDFDWSVTGPHAWWTARNRYKDNYAGLRSSGNWFAALYYGSPEFRAALSARWSEARPLILDTIDKVRGEKSKIELAAKKNWYKWHGFSFAGTFDSCYDEVLLWCEKRAEWLDGAFAYQNN